MLLLMTVAGIDSLRSLGKLNQVSREVSHRYVEHNQALHTIVVLFHRYDNEVEQYLLADVIVANVPSRDDIEMQGTAVHLAIHNYPADSNADERAPLKKIVEALDREANTFASAQCLPMGLVAVAAGQPFIWWASLDMDRGRAVVKFQRSGLRGL